LLNGCELTTEEGQKKFKESDYLNKVCKPCVKSVVEKLEKYVLQQKIFPQNKLCFPEQR